MVEMFSEKDFKDYVHYWANCIGVQDKITSIHLRPMRKKIASCSIKGRLTFDPSILEQSKDRIDEIIVHELLHLKIPNHGRLFKVLLNLYIDLGRKNNINIF